MKLYRDDETIEAVWAIDAETGIEWLLDLKTGERLAKRDPKDGLVARPE